MMIWYVVVGFVVVVLVGLLAGWLWPHRVEDGALPAPDPGRLPIQIRVDSIPDAGVDDVRAAFFWAQEWWDRQIEEFSPFAPSRLPGAIVRVQWAREPIGGAAMLTRHRLRRGRLLSSEVLVGFQLGGPRALLRR